MGTGQVNVLIIGIICLRLLLDDRPISHGGPQSQSANSHTHY